LDRLQEGYSKVYRAEEVSSLVHCGFGEAMLEMLEKAGGTNLKAQKEYYGNKLKDTEQCPDKVLHLLVNQRTRASKRRGRGGGGFGRARAQWPELYAEAQGR